MLFIQAFNSLRQGQKPQIEMSQCLVSPIKSTKVLEYNGLGGICCLANECDAF